MNKLIKYFNENYGKKYNNIEYPRTNIQMYQAYQVIKDLNIEDKNLDGLLNNTKLPKPKTLREREMYSECIYTPKTNGGIVIEGDEIFITNQDGEKYKLVVYGYDLQAFPSIKNDSNIITLDGVEYDIHHKTDLNYHNYKMIIRSNSSYYLYVSRYPFFIYEDNNNYYIAWSSYNAWCVYSKDGSFQGMGSDLSISEPVYSINIADYYRGNTQDSLENIIWTNFDLHSSNTKEIIIPASK